MKIQSKLDCKDTVLAGYNVVLAETRAEKETAMCADTRTEAQQAKDYLIKSLNAARDKAEDKAARTYGLIQPMPKTGKELREWVKAGRVDVADMVLDDTQFDSYWTNPFAYLTFTSDVKKDKEGYDAALKEIAKAASDVKDQIVVMGPEKGLEALNAFKAKTF